MWRSMLNGTSLSLSLKLLVASFDRGILSSSEVSLPTSCKTQSSLSESFVDSKSSLVSEVEQFESLAVDTLAKADNFMCADTRSSLFLLVNFSFVRLWCSM